MEQLFDKLHVISAGPNENDDKVIKDLYDTILGELGYVFDDSAECWIKSIEDEDTLQNPCLDGMPSIFLTIHQGTSPYFIERFYGADIQFESEINSYSGLTSYFGSEDPDDLEENYFEFELEAFTIALKEANKILRADFKLSIEKLIEALINVGYTIEEYNPNYYIEEQMPDPNKYYVRYCWTDYGQFNEDGLPGVEVESIDSYGTLEEALDELYTDISFNEEAAIYKNKKDITEDILADESNFKNFFENSKEKQHTNFEALTYEQAIQCIREYAEEGYSETMDEYIDNGIIA